MSILTRQTVADFCQQTFDETNFCVSWVQSQYQEAARDVNQMRYAAHLMLPLLSVAAGLGGAANIAAGAVTLGVILSNPFFWAAGALAAATAVVMWRMEKSYKFAQAGVVDKAMIRKLYVDHPEFNAATNALKPGSELARFCEKEASKRCIEILDVKKEYDNAARRLRQSRDGGQVVGALTGSFTLTALLAGHTLPAQDTVAAVVGIASTFAAAVGAVTVRKWTSKMLARKGRTDNTVKRYYREEVKRSKYIKSLAASQPLAAL